MGIQVMSFDQATTEIMELQRRIENQKCAIEFLQENNAQYFEQIAKYRQFTEAVLTAAYVSGDLATINLGRIILAGGQDTSAKGVKV